MHLAAVLLLLALAVPSVTLAEPGADVVGLYFDDGDDYFIWRRIALPAFQQADVFLILSHPSGSSGVIGWELELDVTASPSVLVSNLEIRGGSIQVIPEWDGRADLLEMLPPADAIVLASFKILLLASIEHPLFIGPVEQSTLLDDPCYWDISAPETPIALNHFMGTWAAPVAWINWFSPNEPTSWSRVKALYGG